MKTSEMIAMLEKNPKLRFTRIDEPFGYGGAVSCVNGRLMGTDGQLYAFVLNRWNDAMTDWTLVREPVTWQEAIQAWIDGKTVKVECSKHCPHAMVPSGVCGKFRIVSSIYCPGKDSDTICRHQIQSGTWYIENE